MTGGSCGGVRLLLRAQSQMPEETGLVRVVVVRQLTKVP